MVIPSKTFCSMAWNHQFIDPTGRVKPCCRFAESFRPAEHNLHNKSLESIFYGDWMTSMREKMLKGETIPGCVRCQQEEAAGKKSLRERYHDNQDLPIDKLVDIQHPKIRWIELAISNDCNLACRMCDSRYSWKWFKEEQFIYNTTLSKNEHSKSNIEEIYPFINDLVHLKFTGGEPLITKDHWLLLDKLLTERNCDEIFLNYSTNCTIMPKDSWIENWSKFKRVEFALSFDSICPQESEYIRWPAKFVTIEKVVRRFLELKRTHNFICILRSTVSILNIWNLPETMLWWHENDSSPNKDMNPTHLTYPNFLSITVLPKHLKIAVENKFIQFKGNDVPKLIRDHLDYILNHMNSQDNSHLLPQFQNYISKTDEYRGQNFSQLYPQFKELMDNCPAKDALSFHK